MKILAVDTTTRFLCLGLYDGSRIYEYNLEVGRQLSSLLTVTIQRALDALGWRINDIDYFACGLGPGSFTGLRVGLATIKAMGWSLNKPLVGIPTLDILARNAKGYEGQIIPIIDAKRNLIYCSVYQNKNGRLMRLKPYLLLAEKDFLKQVKTKAVLLGDALELYRDKILSHIKGANLLDKDYWYPRAHNIIELALERIKEKKLDSPFKIKPIYLYPKECQVKNADYHR